MDHLVASFRVKGKATSSTLVLALRVLSQVSMWLPFQIFKHLASIRALIKLPVFRHVKISFWYFSFSCFIFKNRYSPVDICIPCHFDLLVACGHGTPSLRNSSVYLGDSTVLFSSRLSGSSFWHICKLVFLFSFLKAGIMQDVGLRLFFLTVFFLGHLIYVFCHLQNENPCL